MKHKRHVKRLLSLLLGACMLVTSVVPAFAAEPEPQVDVSGAEQTVTTEPPAENGADVQQPADDGGGENAEDPDSSLPQEDAQEPEAEEGTPPAADEAEQIPQEQQPCKICGAVHPADEPCPLQEESMTLSESGQTILDLTKGSVSISADAVSGKDETGADMTTVNPQGYYIKGAGTQTSNGITVTGGTHKITIDSVVIKNASTKFGIGLLENAKVVLTIKGNNTIQQPNDSRKAAVSVPSGCSLTIEGTDADSLKVSSTTHINGAGIGGNYKEAAGDITINGGVIQATGASCSAGIGGASGDKGFGTITINGGIVTAQGGYCGAGIGGGWATYGTGAYGEAIIINGGTVNAYAGPSSNTTDERGIGAGIGGGQNTYVKKIEINGGTITAQQGTVTAGNAENAQDIGRSSWADGSGNFTALEDIPESLVTINGGTINAVNNKITPVDASGAELQKTVISTGLPNMDVTVASGGTTWQGKTNEDGDLCLYLTGEKQTVRLVASDKTTLSYTVENNTASEELYTVLYLDKGSITIGDGTVTGYDAAGTLVKIPNSNGYTITQSNPNVTVANTVQITGGKHVITLENVKIKASGKGITLSGGAKVDLTLVGTNSVQSTAGGGNTPVCVPGGCAITINGTDADTLTATGATSAAGIGGEYRGTCGDITINGGTINATGGGCGAGIGGASITTAMGTITINGGIITAKSGYCAAGIGTGWASYGAGVYGEAIIINGGIVNAYAEGKSTVADERGIAAGIGAGQNAYVKRIEINGGTITARQGDITNANAKNAQDIGSSSWADVSGVVTDAKDITPSPVVVTGGTINALNNKITPKDASGNAEQKTIISVGAANEDVSVTSGGHTWLGRTSASGELYLYLTSAKQPVRVTTSDGTVYNYIVNNNEVTEANATSLYLDKGNIVIGDGTVSGFDKDGVQVTAANANGYIITQTDPDATVSNTVRITGGTQNIMLQSVNFLAPKESDRNFRITGNANVTLTIAGKNRVVLQKNGNAANRVSAIAVEGGSSLTIEGTDSDSLYASANDSGCGIGGFYKGTCGDITINGGNITALAGSYSAAIGGASGNTAMGKITINGGTIYAASSYNGPNGYCAAGIGSGGRWVNEIGAGTQGEILITGGNITAFGGSVGPNTDEKGSGAAIGAGQNDFLKSVTITGGTIVANGGKNAKFGTQQDIGSGCGASLSAASLTVPETPVYISGASVHTTTRTVPNALAQAGGSAVTMVEVPTWKADATASIKVGETVWTATTDANGCLYPYLETGKAQIIEVTIEGDTRPYQIAENAISGVMVTPSVSFASQAAGAAEGTVTISHPGTDNFAEAYALYWGDDDGLLTNYSIIDTQARTAASTSYKLAKDLFIPNGATKLYVYEMHGGKEFIRVGAYTIPADKRAVQEVPLYSFAVGADARAHNNSTQGAPLYTSYIRNTMAELNNPSAIFNLGNMILSGSSNGYSAKSAAEAVVSGHAPIHDAIGPNEWGLGLSKWQSSTGNSSVYYAKEYNGARFIVLGSTVAGDTATLGSAQLSWLENELSTANSNHPAFVFLHQPISNTTAGTTDLNKISDEADLVAILNKYPNTVVFSAGLGLSMQGGKNIRNGEGTAPSYVNVGSIYDVSDLGGANDSQFVMVEVLRNSVRVRGYDSVKKQWIPTSDMGVYRTPYQSDLSASITYTFNKSDRAFAGGKIAVTDESIICDSYNLYWGNESGKLANYDPLRNVARSGSGTSYTVPDTVMIPYGATSLLAYRVTGGTEEGDPCARFDIPALKQTLQETPITTFVSTSDYQMGVNGTDAKGAPSAEHLAKTMADILVNAPDAAGIFAIGDVTDGGQTAQYAKVKEVLDQYPTKPPMYYVTGNHDLYISDGPNNFKAFTGYDSLWNKWEVNGYTVIALSNSTTGGNKSTLGTTQLNWLSEQLAAAPANKPVFVLNHQTVRNTVNGSFSGQWGYNNGINDEAALLDVINEYPNVVFISGHTHTPLTGGGALYDGGGTGPSYLNDAAIAYLDTEATTDSYNVGAQGVYIDVYKDKLVLRSRDFRNGQWISGGTMLLDMSWMVESLEGTVQIKGTAKVGETLTADVSAITTAGATYTYAWYREGVLEPVSTESTYRLTAADVGKTITLSVIGSGDFAGELTSAATAAVTKADGPAAPAAPTVLSQTETTVTLNTVEGQEYRIGTDGAWQTSGEFTGLMADTAYSFYTRVAETESAFAGAISAALQVTLEAEKKGVTVSGSASFGAGKVPQIAALTAENGLAIDTDSAVSGDYTLTRTVGATAGKHSVTFAVTKTGETKAAISVKLTGVNEDLSGVTATFKAASLSARAFTFDLNMVPAGTYSVEAYKKNHTVGTMTGIPVETAPVNLGKTLEMLAGDLNGDNQITIADKTLLVGRFSTSNTEYDVNDDGSITILDKTLLVAQFSKKGKTVHF